MADPALLDVLRQDEGAMGWLRNSLKHELAEARKRERLCRARSGSPTIVLASQRLADAHKRAADVYAAALGELDGKGTR